MTTLQRWFYSLKFEAAFQVKWVNDGFIGNLIIKRNEKGKMCVLISILVYACYTCILACWFKLQAWATYSYGVLHLWYTCYYHGELISFIRWKFFTRKECGTWHVLVLSVEYAYKTYELNGKRQIWFCIEMLCGKCSRLCNGCVGCARTWL